MYRCTGRHFKDGFIAMNLKLLVLGCEQPEDCDQSKHVAARSFGIYISIIRASVGTKRL
jgi:hypothetical protein